METITIPATCEVIGPICFSGKCQSVLFEANSRLQRIEEEAFAWALLQTIVIPARVEYIGERCFWWCRDLRSVTFERGSRLKTLGSFAFSNNNIGTLELPAQCEFLDGSSLSGIKSVTVDAGNQFFMVDGPFLVSRDGKRLVRYIGSGPAVVIKKEIEVIGSYCFCQCGFLKQVTIEPGSSLIKIEKHSFDETGVNELVIPMNAEVVKEKTLSIWLPDFENHVVRLKRGIRKPCAFSPPPGKKMEKMPYST
jgi:hypothetical protein